MRCARFANCIGLGRFRRLAIEQDVTSLLQQARRGQNQIQGAAWLQLPAVTAQDWKPSRMLHNGARRWQIQGFRYRSALAVR
jgi:hypothetical protein